MNVGERQNKTFELFVNKLVISSQSVSAEKIKLQNATLTLIKKCTFSFRLRRFVFFGSFVCLIK